MDIKKGQTLSNEHKAKISAAIKGTKRPDLAARNRLQAAKKQKQNNYE